MRSPRSRRAVPVALPRAGDVADVPGDGLPGEPASAPADDGTAVDLADVRGQAVARRALEIALAGGHALLLIGPPGAGKTLLARTIPPLLPDLDDGAALAATVVASAASPEPVEALVRRPPVRMPHHTTSYAGMVGGGPRLSPGEVTFADQGVLFCDELPEFGRDVLEALRQPLEDGHVSVVRVGRAATFPARFTFIAAMNPCPCGQDGAADRVCACPPHVPERYRRRVSGPLRDRIDLWVRMDRVAPEVLLGGSAPEGSAMVARRIAAARQRRQARTGDLGNVRLHGRDPPGGLCDGRRRGGQGHHPRGTGGAVRTGRGPPAPGREDHRGPRGRRGRGSRPPGRGGSVPGSGGPDDAAGGGLMLGVGRAGPLGRVDATDLGGARNPDDVERDAWVVLNGVTGVGPVSFGRLVASFGSAAAVLRAARRTGAVAGMVAATVSQDGGGPTLAPSAGAAIVAAARDPGRLLVPVRRSGLQVLTLADEAYPSRLRRVDLPPPVLFLHGDLAALDRCARGRDRRDPSSHRRRARDRRQDRRGRQRARRHHRLRARPRHRRRGPRRRGPSRHSDHRGDRRWPRPPVPGRSPGPRPGDRGGWRSGRERVRPRHHPHSGDVSAPEPDHQRPCGRNRRRGGRCPERGPDDGGMGAGAGEGAPPRAGTPRRSCRGGLPRLPAGGRAGGSDRRRDPGVARGPGALRGSGGRGERSRGRGERGRARTRRRPRHPRHPRTCATRTPLRAVLTCLGPLERAVALEVVAGRGTVDELVFATGAAGAAVLGVLTVLEVRGLVLEAYGRYRAAGPLASAAATRRPRPVRVRAA